MNLFQKLKQLKNTKFKFFLPKKNRIVFYDCFIFNDHSKKFLNPYLKLDDITDLDLRFKEIYLLILIKVILKKGFRKDILFNYTLEFIRYVKPKLVLSFTDSDLKFYELKNFFPEIKFICIQIGYRSINNPDLFSKLISKKNENLKSDFILCYGKGVAKEYEKYIKCKAIPIGSFKNNCFSSKRKSKDFRDIKNIFFISQYRSYKTMYRSDLNIEGMPREIFYKPESLLLPKLQNKCYEKGYTLNILGCTTDVKGEYDFFKKILKNDKFKYLKITDSLTDKELDNLNSGKSNKIDILRSLKDGGIGSYIRLNDADIIFFIDSTLGYEMLSLGHRCASFHSREVTFKNSDILGQAGFGWPSIKKNETGKFWTNLLDEREADRIIDYILNVNEEDWANDLNSISDVMSYDDGNSFFVKMLNNLK